MFKIFEPNKIFQFTSRAPKYVLFLFVVVLSVGLVEALILSPEDYKQSDAVRIMYVHVPSAWISLGIFTSITFLSICGFIFKNKNFFLISKSLAPSGFVFNLIALVTGSIWGKPTWGTYWVWDARITSTFILLIQYIGLVALRSSFNSRQTADQILSIVAIIGAVNIPIIKFSVNWWNTLHQNASITTSGSAIDSEMLIGLPMMLVSLLFISFHIFARNIQYEILNRTGRTAMMREIING